jgi:hypothetical protein
MRFTYLRTTTDLLEAFDAITQDRTGMRPWIRYMVVGMGIMWLTGVLLILTHGLGDTPPLQPILWLIFGSGVTWLFGIRPILRRRTIGRQPDEQKVIDVEYSEEGLNAIVEGVAVKRDWHAFSGFYVHKKGFLCYMKDGIYHWLTERVFTSREQKAELIALFTRCLAAIETASEST